MREWGNGAYPDGTAGREVVVLVVEPGKTPEVRRIRPTTEAVREMVGGDAEEICPFDEPAAIAYNRDGDRLHLAGNLLLKNGSGQPYALIRGTFLVIGVSSGAYVSLTDAQIIQLRARICRDRLPYSGSNAAPCRLS